VSRLLIYLGTVAGFYFLVGVGLMLGLSTPVDNFGEGAMVLLGLIAGCRAAVRRLRVRR